MKHSVKIVTLLLVMFFVTQLIGLAVINVYASHNDNIPYGMNPPEDISPTQSLLSISFAMVFAVVLMFLLMKIRTEWFLRIWFFFVITIALGITINAFFISTPLSNYSLNLLSSPFPLASSLAIALAIPLAFVKVFQRNFLVHNLTELLIYPGIAAIFVPILSIWTAVVLLILISIYDMWAVWHSGIMQKMAKYQMNNLKIFSGFFIPYLGKKEADMVKQAKVSKKSLKNKKIKVNLAILGGGDVVFPIILAGVVLRQFGMLSAIIISICASLALLGLFYISKKGKFYPAMPFISAGCFVGLTIVYLIR